MLQLNLTIAPERSRKGIGNQLITIKALIRDIIERYRNSPTALS